MSCEWTEERLPLLRYGELEGRERDDVLAHLEGCAPCREARAALDASAAALESVPLRHPDAARVGGLKDRVLAAVGATGCAREQDLLDPAADPAELAAHATQCAPCREAAAAFGQVRAALDRAPVELPAASVLAASKAAILARTGATTPAAKVTKFPLRGVAVAAAVLLVAGAFALGRITAPSPAQLEAQATALVRAGQVDGERGWVAPAIRGYELALQGSPDDVLRTSRELAALRRLQLLPPAPQAEDLEQLIVEFPDAETTARAVEALVRLKTPKGYPIPDDVRQMTQSHRVLQVIELRDGMRFEDLGDLTKAREAREYYDRARECYERVLDAPELGDSPAAHIARERLARLG